MREQPKNNVVYRIVSQQRDDRLTIQCLEQPLHFETTAQDLIAKKELISGFDEDDTKLIYFIAEQAMEYS